MVNKCVGCGRDFESPNKKEYCGNKCYHKVNYTKQEVSHVCVYCGNRFTSRQKRTKFCSVACGNKHRRREQAEVIHCRVCGKELGKLVKNRAYCSKECRNVWVKENPRWTKECLTCGKEFKTNEKDQKYCGTGCQPRVFSETERSYELLQKRILSQREEGFLIFQDNFTAKFNGRFQYVSGYMNCASTVNVKCLACGNEMTVNAQVARNKRDINCKACREIEAAKREQQKRAATEKKRAEREEKERHAAEKKAKRDKLLNKICPVCQQGFLAGKTNQKFCSDVCANKESNRRQEIRRRHKLRENGKIDYSITLSVIVKKHKRVCALCGKKVDMSVHSNHDNYPSIDHIIPVAKGGTHTWDNVQLAHRTCNTIKRDSLPEDDKKIAV